MSAQRVAVPQLDPEEFPAETTPTWLQPFVPRRLLRNGHLQTIVGNFIPRNYVLPEPEARLVEVAPAHDGLPATRVLCHCHWQPETVRAQRLTVVLVHGLEGSSSSRYILGNTARAWSAGCNVVRMNMRSCGGTDELSPSIYHSGLSQDVLAVTRDVVREHALQAVALVGYSMGGNLVLKLVGELGPAAPDYLKAAVGISPLMDLAASSAALHLPINRGYERHFLASMLRRLRQKAVLFPQAFTTEGLEKIHTMRDFDEHIVARYGGFRDADDYYHSVASSRFAAGITVPTLIVHALDDPFIRMLPATRETLLANPHVTFIETRHGGHCAFLSPEPGSDRHWAEKTLLGFLLSTVPTTGTP